MMGRGQANMLAPPASVMAAVFVSSANSEGSEPLKCAECNNNICRLPKRPSCDGTVPEIALVPNSKCVRDVSTPSSVGSVPLRPALVNRSTFRVFGHLLGTAARMRGWICPRTMLLAKSRCVRTSNLASCVGSPVEKGGHGTDEDEVDPPAKVPVGPESSHTRP